MKPRWELFDDQAAIFEQRAGLPAGYCQQIARTVLKVAQAGPGDLLVEVGAGTGQVGQWFGTPIRYVGIDLSAGMLAEFRRRLGGQPGSRMLVRADANDTWPIAGGAARVIFSSRAIHLLEHEHVASEVSRVGAPSGVTFIIGRVERARDSVRARMAREMIERLRRRGFEGRRGEYQHRRLIELCYQRGAEVLEPLYVARWRVRASPRQSLDSWRCLKGLGGIPLPDATRNAILTELEAWADGVFGGLDGQFESEETYALRPLRLMPAGGR